MKHTIQVTIQLENQLWVGIFERNDKHVYAVARKVFGKEPTDPEVYEFILSHYQELQFTEPQDFILKIKRKNPKRMNREVRKLMQAAKNLKAPKMSRAQEVLKMELEKNKKIRKTISKEEKEAKQ